MKLICLLSVLFLLSGLPAGELMLAEKGKSRYQIVLPDHFYDAGVRRCVNAAAKELAKAFKAGAGAEIAVVSEKNAGNCPGIYLGNTEKLRKLGIDVAGFKDFEALIFVHDGNVFIAGNDRHGKWKKGNDSYHRYLLGTVKGVVAFMEDYLHVRFLMPGEIGTEIPEISRVVVSDRLNRRITPPLRFAVGRHFTMMYDYANNNYGYGSFHIYGGHSYYDAIPVKKYAKTHPGYFSLAGGRRLTNAVYFGHCISNPEVQKLVYAEILKRLDDGADTVEVGVTDGYVPCECASCRAFGNVSDPGEKLWILHREMAERLRKDRPGKKLMLIAYSPTRRPPQTFHEFPENVMIELADSSPESFDAWRKIKVPQGFSVYLYNWGQYNPGGLTPKTSPAFCAEQVRFFMRNQVKGIYRCGFGELFGLEGPAYYVFGKIFDDPEKSAKELLADYCRNAFREAAFPMHVFYENLYQRLDMIPHPDYRNSEAFVSRPMTLLPLLYSWDLLAAMGKNLAEAEAKAIGPKVKKRLELVRLEFNYLNNLASVIHLYNAYKISPSQALFEPLARKIEERNSMIDSLYAPDGSVRPFSGWQEIRPFGGDTRMRLKANGRMRAILHSPFTWDIASLRANKILPGFGNKSLKIFRADGPVSGHDFSKGEWQKAPWHDLAGIQMGKIHDRTRFKILYDAGNLYIGIETDLNETREFKPYGRDGSCWNADCLELILDPWGTREKYFHLIFNPAKDSCYDAAFGMITDPLHPQFNGMDVSWNGKWTYSNVRKNGKWLAMVTVPFDALGVKAPRQGTVWTMNIGRESYTVPNKDNTPELSLWTPSLESGDFHDRNSFGEAVFQ